MIPLAVPNLSGNEAAYLQQCITSTFVSSVGPFVDRLEELVADATESRGATAVSTGTAGLHLALRVVGVRPGDLVVMPSLTFIASANAIAYCHASPWLFDIAPDTLTIDPAQVADAFEHHVAEGPDGPIHMPTGRRVAAMLPVHTLGHPADVDPLVTIAERFRIPVIADAAAALGARYRGRPIGQAGATISVFSFNGNKTVTAGGGGALVTDDQELLDRARHLSTTARVGADYDHDEVGFNYRMTNVQAAVGCAQLEQLDTFVAAKRRIQQTYTDQLADIAGLTALPEAPWANSARWLTGFSLTGWDPDRVVALRAKLRDDGIDARPFWKPIHLQRPYVDVPAEPLSDTEDVWWRVITLPCSTGISDGDLAAVIAAVRTRINE